MHSQPGPIGPAGCCFHKSVLHLPCVRSGSNDDKNRLRASDYRHFQQRSFPTRRRTGPHSRGPLRAFSCEGASALGLENLRGGKFHTPGRWDMDIGYEVHLHSQELYATPDQRKRDSYAAWIREKHPEFDYIEGLMGERTEMYYMPQLSPEPAEASVERWAADRAIELIQKKDERPFFGFVSFIGPHPPFAPPIPFNRIYDPDRMPNPNKGRPFGRPCGRADTFYEPTCLGGGHYRFPCKGA